MLYLTFQRWVARSTEDVGSCSSIARTTCGWRCGLRRFHWTNGRGRTLVSADPLGVLQIDLAWDPHHPVAYSALRWSLAHPSKAISFAESSLWQHYDLSRQPDWPIQYAVSGPRDADAGHAWGRISYPAVEGPHLESSLTFLSQSVHLSCLHDRSSDIR